MKKKRVTRRVCGVVGLLLLATGVKAVTISAESPGGTVTSFAAADKISPAYLGDAFTISCYGTGLRWNVFDGSPPSVLTGGYPCIGYLPFTISSDRMKNLYIGVTNDSAVPVTVSLTYYSLRVGSWVKITNATINPRDPGASCSANVNTAVNLGKLSGGVTPGRVAIVSPGESVGNLTFTPDYAISGKGALRNPVSGTSLTYGVSGATWDMAHGRWTGSSSVAHSLMLDTPPLDVKAGQYKGTLTVTINCT